MAHRISYTSKDYNSIINELLGTPESNYDDGKVKELTENWTDFRESDLGVVLVELMSMMGDMVNYNIDRQALENILLTSQEKKNVRAKLRSYGYKMKTYSSAEVEVQFESDHSTDIVIDKYVSLSTNEIEGKTIKYLTYSQEILPAESNTEVNCIQGDLVEVSLSDSDIDNRSRIQLPDKDIAEGTIELVLDGDGWNEVDDVVLHPEDGRYYSMDFDKYDNVYITLIPGWTNFVRNENNLNIEVKYIKSDGESGMIGKYALKNIEGELFDIEGNEASENVVIRNLERSRGGEDPESIEEAKVNGINLIQTMWTAVTLEDYEVLCNNFSGVSNSLALDWGVSEVEWITEPYIVEIYVVPNDGGSVTTQLEDDLLDYLDNRKVTTVDIQIKDTTYYSVDLYLDVYVFDTGVSLTTIESDLNNTLDNYFDYDNRSFSEIIEYSNLISLVENTHESISRVDIRVPAHTVLNDGVSNGEVYVKASNNLNNAEGYIVDVKNPGTDDSDLTVTWDSTGEILIVSLATTSDITPILDDSINTAKNIAEEINILSNFDASYSGDGSGVFTGEETKTLSGDTSDVDVPFGEYPILGNVNYNIQFE